MYPDVPAPAAASVEADAAEPVALPLWRKRAAVAGAQGQAAVAAGAQVEFEASNRLRVTTAVLAEMLNYRTVPCTQTNPLQWWKKHCHEFPYLAQLARLVLAVPATSAPSERMFSQTGLFVRAKRANLDPSMVHVLVF